MNGVCNSKLCKRELYLYLLIYSYGTRPTRRSFVGGEHDPPASTASFVDPAPRLLVRRYPLKFSGKREREGGQERRETRRFKKIQLDAESGAFYMF